MTVALTTLPNGLRVVSNNLAGVETVAIGLHADTGSRFETEPLNGTAHLFEHMVFKGTAQRNARAIAEAVEDVGGSLNAYTARDATVFHARLLAEDLSLGIELVADLVQNALFDEDELERERHVVLSELGEARDTPDDIVFDHLQLAAFPAQALGRSILGSEESIAAIDAAALRGWQAEHYRAQSCVLSAAGKIDHGALVALAEAWFGGMPEGARPAAEPGAFAPTAFHDRRKFEQAHMTLGYAAPGHDDPDFDAINLFTTAVGGGMSSRLFQELREERGLAYSIFAQTSAYADTGLFAVYLATARRDAGKALALTDKVVADCAATLEESELARARAQLRAGLLMSLESPAGQADYLARQLLVRGRVTPPAEIIARLDACDAGAVRAAAQRMLEGGPARADVGALTRGRS